MRTETQLLTLMVNASNGLNAIGGESGCGVLCILGSVVAMMIGISGAETMEQLNLKRGCMPYRPCMYCDSMGMRYCSRHKQGTTTQIGTHFS